MHIETNAASSPDQREFNEALAAHESRCTELDEPAHTAARAFATAAPLIGNERPLPLPPGLGPGPGRRSGCLSLDTATTARRAAYTLCPPRVEWDLQHLALGEMSAAAEVAVDTALAQAWVAEAAAAAAAASATAVAGQAIAGETATIQHASDVALTFNGSHREHLFASGHLPASDADDTALPLLRRPALWLCAPPAFLALETVHEEGTLPIELYRTWFLGSLKMQSCDTEGKVHGGMAFGLRSKVATVPDAPPTGE